jgi:hypothetical protein
LLACGTQDNGNLFLAPRQEGGQAWQSTGLPISDGGLCLFVDFLSALIQVSNVAPSASIGFWNDALQQFGGFSVIPADGNTSGITPTGVSAVTEPRLTSRGLFCACAGTAAGGIYGFYMDPRPPGFGPGSRFSFRRIGGLSTEVVGIACRDGQTIFAGTIDGRIVRVDEATGAMTDEALPPEVAPMIVSRIEVVRPRSGVVLVEDDLVHALDGGTILRRRYGSWRTLPGTWQTFAFDVGSGRLFAADEASVYEYVEAEHRWTSAGRGLPAYAHCTDLRLAPMASGGMELLLATYGRSVWRAQVTLPPAPDGPPRVPQEVNQVIFGVIEDGGGLVRVGPTIVKIPPRPFGRDLLVALAMYELAGAMSSTATQVVRRAIAEEMKAVIARELERAGGEQE